MSARPNRATRRAIARGELPASESDISRWFKWYYYSTYHPSWDTEEVLRDFNNGTSIRDATLRLVWHGRLSPIIWS